MTDLILHSYDASPFTQRVLKMLAIKGLEWRSVTTSIALRSSASPGRSSATTALDMPRVPAALLSAHDAVQIEPLAIVDSRHDPGCAG